MAKRVHPSPESKSVDAGGSSSSTLLTPPFSGPLHRGGAIQEKRRNAKDDTVCEAKNDPNNNTSASRNRTTSWANAAKFAANPCCLVGEGCGDIGVFECGSGESGGGMAHAPHWMDYLWLSEGEGKGKWSKRQSRRARMFLQQQPSGSSKNKDDKFSQNQPFNAIDPKLLETDFTQLHEEFFESLLKEQGKLVIATSATPADTSSLTNRDRVLRKSESRDTCSSFSSGLSTMSMKTTETSAATSAMSTSLPPTTSVQTLHKKHRPLRLHRLVPKGSTGRHKNSSEGSPDPNQPYHHHHARIPPIEAYNQMYNPSLATNEVISLDTIMAKENLKSPSEYVHPQCMLQKDKGRGDKLKATISAKGREQCLEKLRNKIRLVLQMSSATGSTATGGRDEQYQRKWTNTGMKRRMAKIADVGPSYIETRSMLEVQLGFLSMQYGLLIHWDTAKTGKIVFICLRKMCNDGFYSKIPDLLQEPTLLLQQQQQLYPSNCQQRHQSPVVATAKQEAAPPLVVRCHKGNHAIYQRLSGSTEVVLVDAPYRIPQPEVFAPSILSVDIHEVTGLDHRRSQWTLSVTFDGHTEIAHLIYNPQTKSFQTTRTTPCKWEMVLPRQMTSFDMAGLEIRLFEQRSGRLAVGRSVLGGHDLGKKQVSEPSSRYGWRNSHSSSRSSTMTPKLNPPKKSTSRLASTMTMPLGGLVSQPSTSQTTVWKLTIPFTHDESAQLTLTLAHQSEYANWLYKELRARRKEELAASSASSWQPSLLKRLVSLSHDGSLLGVDDAAAMDYHFDSDEDEGDDFYLSDWLCGICYLFPISSSK
jgi:hypothetical protein